jgi:WD40 repeat protein
MKHQGVEGAFLTKDEQRILSWGGDELRLWDAATGRQIGPAMKHQGVKGALSTKDEQRIVSWGRDELRLWDAATGQQIGPAMQGADVEGTLVTRDGRRIVSWGQGGVQLWDVSWPSGNLLEVACALLPDRELSSVAKRYGIQLTAPICSAIAAPDPSTIELAPAGVN